MLKPNLVIICQLKSFNKVAAKAAADKLEMFYVDTDELMSFEHIDMKELLEKHGPERYKQIETGTIKEVATFENSVITTGSNSIFSLGLTEYVKRTCHIIYLQVPFKLYQKEKKHDQTELNKNTLILDEMVFSETDKIYTRECDAVVSVKKATGNVAVRAVTKAVIKAVKKLIKQN